ncbi:hypothetical protein [Ruminococcus sp. Marseille-P6503]|uniref:hypothetical protein n=1 Tax=Ruminococcus sp. Marseille-P6503 TaxID=2364796 RepID=UPI000F54AA9D|nr:hypothetical protein [Ruminococcus sp. Marseille-P6503]
MINRIIETEKSDPIKAEFERIRMPDESKKRVLNRLLEDQKEREAMPENAVKAKPAEGAKIKSSRSFVSIAAAAAVCIAAVFAQLYIEGEIKKDENEAPPAAVSSGAESAAQVQQDMNDWTPNLENDLYHVVPGTTSVDFKEIVSKATGESQSVIDICDICEADGRIYILYLCYSGEGSVSLGSMDASAGDFNELYSVSCEAYESVSYLSGRFVNGGAYILVGNEVYGYSFNEGKNVFNVDFDELDYTSFEVEIVEYQSTFSNDMKTMYFWNSENNAVIYTANVNGEVKKYPVVDPAGESIGEENVINVYAASDGTLYYNMFSYESGEVEEDEIGFLTFTQTGECMTNALISQKSQDNTTLSVIGTDRNGGFYYYSESEDNIKVTRCGSDGQVVYSEELNGLSEADIQIGYVNEASNFIVSDDGEYLVYMKEVFDTLSREYYDVERLEIEVYQIDTGDKITDWSISDVSKYNIVGILPVTANGRVSLYLMRTERESAFIYDIYSSDTDEINSEIMIEQYNSQS